jgi:hypothetical protein
LQYKHYLQQIVARRRLLNSKHAANDIGDIISISLDRDPLMAKGMETWR